MQAKKVSNFNGLRLLVDVRSTNSTKTQNVLAVTFAFKEAP